MIGSQRPVMPASNDEDVLARLLSRIIEAMRPDQIWLFGSRARGGARANSDWDLLVVLPDDATDDDLDLMRAWQTVRDLRIPADVIPVRRSEFEEARDHAGTLVRTVVGEGKQIYPLDRLTPYATTYRYPSPTGRLKAGPDASDVLAEAAEIEGLLQRARRELGVP
jgi:predicted nucleotidyltransferase